MIFGNRRPLTRRQAMTACASLVSTLFLLPLTGCSGGNDNGTGGSGTKVPVTGTIVDYDSGIGVVGYTVTFGGVSTTTVAGGAFSINAPGTSASSNLVLTSPLKADSSPQYYSTILNKGNVYTGGSIPVSATAGKPSADVGIIQVGNVDTTPPFPPTF